MSDVATALLQLIGRPEPAADPALAAVKLARASLDALVLRLGQSIDAKVTAQLAGGLTQLSAGGESFVLKLETALPVNTAVTLKISPGPMGQPAVTVTLQAPPPIAQPAPPAPPPVAPLPSPVTQSPQPVSSTPAPALAAAPTVTLPAPAASSPVALLAPAPAPSIIVATAPPQPPAPVQPSAIGAQPPAIATPAAPTEALLISAPPAQPAVATAQLPQAPPQASPVVVAPAPPSAPPAPAQVIPAATTVVPPSPSTGAPPAVVGPVPAANPAPVATAPTPVPAPLVAAPAVPIASGPTSPPAQPVVASPVPRAPNAPAFPMPAVAPSPTPAPALFGPAPQAAAPTALPAPSVATTLPPSPRTTLPPASPPLAQILADPVQAAARQDSILPLIARLATLTGPTAVALPRPAIEALAMLLGTRLDLNRGPPDGKTVRDAVLRAGVITEPGSRSSADVKSALLQLRSALSGFLGGAVDAVAPVTRRPPPPLKGEPVRAPAAQPAAPLPDEPAEAARQLLGHADAALSRTKLLQLASSPADAARPAIAAPAAEFRVEVPMQLGAETGILQLLVERDGKHKHKRTPAERGWRMRFALNFSATGEVGAEVALFGRSASIALWAADPDTADALEAMLPELAPALARHGLDVGAVRLRRGPPQPAARVPGQLLDSAR